MKTRHLIVTIAALLLSAAIVSGMSFVFVYVVPMLREEAIDAEALKLQTVASEISLEEATATAPNFESIISDAASTYSARFALGSKVGKILAASGLGDIKGKTWNETPLSQAVSSGENRVMLAGIDPGDDLLLVQQEVPGQGGKLLMLTPAAQVLATAHAVRNGLFALFIPLFMGFTVLLTTIPWIALRRVSGTAELIQRMARGEVTDRLNENGKAETAELRRAVNAYGDHLSEIVNTVVDGASRMTASATELDTLSGRMRERSATQLQLNAQMDDSVSQLTQAAEEISSNTSAAASRATEASDSIRQGAEVIIANREAAERLTETMTQAKASLGELSEATEKVGGMLNMITEISEQTNLLALNATIEAARAGEAGKGFAVVAAEVGSLAGDTKKATAEIDALLGQFRKSASETIEVIDTSHEISIESKDRAEVVENTYNDISAAFEDIHDRTVSIASAAEEQAAVTQELSNQSGLVRSASEENSQEAEDLYRHARTVREVAANLANIRSGSQNQD